MSRFVCALAGLAVEPCHTEALALILAQVVLIAVMYRIAREL